MFEPIITNPTITGGRQHRFCRTSFKTRNVRTDHVSEERLTTLGEWLADAAAEDRPSVSLIIRQAISTYLDHVRASQRVPGGLDEEKRKVRSGSIRPWRRKKADKNAM